MDSGIVGGTASAPDRTNTTASAPYGVTYTPFSYNEDFHSMPYAKRDLEKTRSTFMGKDAIVDKRGASVYGRIPMLLGLFLIVLFIGVFVHLPAIFFAGAGLVFGFLLIVAGWFEFSLLELIESMPTAKIESAAEGLNEIQGSFALEGKSTFTAPLSKQECIFYQLELQELKRTKNGYYWQSIAQMGNGVPALFTDGTGYLAIDLANANITRTPLGTRYYVVDQLDKLVTSNTSLGIAIRDYIAKDPAAVDFDSIGVGLSLVYKTNFAIFGGTALSVLERTMPLRQPAFAIGRVVGSGGTFDGKPVKQMVYDRASKMLAVRTESKASIEKTDRRLVYLAFGFGALALLLSAAYLLASFA